MQIIRGFSKVTGYSCSHCHHKCCATEYSLPLNLKESQDLKQNYTFCSSFLKPLVSRGQLIRGDACPFLDSGGLCLLHDTPHKPLICQTYPLIFWRVNADLLLVWAHPCRGDGFRWVADADHLITDREIADLTGKINSEFKHYWGEEVDNGNPFSDIPAVRVYEELAFFDESDSSDLQARISKEVLSNTNLELFDQLMAEKEQFEMQDDLLAVINSACYWLCWSPVGLSLTFTNAKLIFLVAANWIEITGRKILARNSKDLPLNRERYLQQLGSFLVTALLPSFWEQARLTSQNRDLQEFSAQVSRVLAGEIPQQDLI